MARFGLKMDDVSLAVIGLGYVGLPLAVAFGNRFDTIGFDTKTARIEELLAGHDSTQEVDDVALAQCRSLKLTHCVGDLRDANVYVVTVPTPIDPSKRPDLTPLRLASSTIGQCLKPGDVVIFESTVYPGASEEICAPVLEEESGLKLNEDFFLGYSPERINPGDKTHRLRGHRTKSPADLPRRRRTSLTASTGRSSVPVPTKRRVFVSPKRPR